jgi:hypothetical protein
LDNTKNPINNDTSLEELFGKYFKPPKRKTKAEANNEEASHRKKKSKHSKK